MNTEQKILKDKATRMGLEFHHALGAKKLKILIDKENERLSKIEQDVEERVVIESEVQVDLERGNAVEALPRAAEPVVPVAPVVVVPLTEMEIKAKALATKVKRHARLRKEQKKLVRIVLRCNDDMKKEWKGQFFKVSNILHTVTRYVPFDNENGWHVEQCLLNTILEMKCQRFKDVKLPNGKKHRKGFNIKAFTVEILKPLNKKEFKILKADQSARGGID